MRPKKQSTASKKNVSSLGEFGLIRRLAKDLKISPDVICGIGDDAAVLKVYHKKHMLMTTDMLVEDVHFSRKMPARAVGYKSMACNISDIAAMGGIPKFAVVSVGLPAHLPVQWVKDFYKGLEHCARKFGVSVVGGDTVKSDKIIINVALTGEADPKRIVLRSGAKPGDIIYVTGRLGNSLKSGRHLKPNPRVEAAQYLVKNFKIHAMIDVSDGLAADLGHILEQSGVGAVLDAEAIPCYPDATLENALYDGEDYELVFTMSKTELPLTPSLNKEGGLLVGAKYPTPLVFKEGSPKGRGRSGFSPIGRIVKNPKVFELHFSDGMVKKIKPQGYKHF